MSLLAPLVVAALAWFVSTGLVFRLDSLPRATFRWSLGAATLVAGGAVWAIVRTAGDTGPTAAYVGFGAALAVWGWHELSFLTGALTGPNRTPATPGLHGVRRFVQATRTLIHHEVALALTAVGIAALTWHQPNQTATLTFALLFGLRLSTKLNIFAGVPQPASDLLPARLGYLKSYFRQRPFGPGMAVSFAAMLGLVALFAARTLGATAGTAARTGDCLLFALTVLGIVEHLFLALPLRDAALFTWAAPANLQRKTAPVLGDGRPKYL